MSSDKVAPLYNVVRVRGRATEVVLQANGQPRVWMDPLNATDWAQRETGYTGIKHQVRPVKQDVNWQEREKKRFATKHYTPLPWHKEPWVKLKECVNHFAHVSRFNEAQIAYTRNEADGLRDVKTAVPPASYLTRFYRELLSEDEIRQYVAQYKKLYDKDNIVKFAYTAKDIVRVYTRGPRSCMSAPARNYRSPVHPSTVYAGPDLAIAYVERKGKITARCVVWPKKKIRSRIYGDTHLLANLLVEEGYMEGSLEGARLTKLKHGNRYVCPYLDSVRYVTVGTRYLTITQKGKHPRIAGNQDGFCGQGFNCHQCNTEQDAAKARHINVDGRPWCLACFEDALSNKRIYRCGHSQGYFLINSAVTMFNGVLWNRYYINGTYGFRCQECKVYYPSTRTHIGRNQYDSIGRLVTVCVSCHTRQQELPV